MQTLVLGGTRSGKSAYAERLAAESAKKVHYIATAQAFDESTKQRIQQHIDSRDSTWPTLEVPLALAEALQRVDDANHILLVDCLTMWVTNLLCHDDQTRIEDEISSLLSCLPTLQSDVILVSNEGGLGITPMTDLTRRYVDEMGNLHQALAQQADRVVLVIAGLPQLLKDQKTNKL